ncbi:MAG: winged helix-turn-helix domain-containing protein, partial [Holophagales bacterium]|nr:winged helix-turn-helix domain-containing protein [Holophagales bacterium]
MDPRGSEILRFGVFELDPASGELRRQGRRVPLAEKPRQVLEALLETPGRVVPRQELCSRLWADGIHVDFDANLNAAVKTLREALGDRATHA